MVGGLKGAFYNGAKSLDACGVRRKRAKGGLLMTRVEIIEEEFLIDELEDEIEQERLAAEDLKRVEDEAKQEAEASAAKADKRGDARAAADAASAAFDFDQAQRTTEDTEGRVESRTEDADDGWVEVVECMVCETIDEDADGQSSQSASSEQDDDPMSAVRSAAQGVASEVKTAAQSVKENVQEAFSGKREGMQEAHDGKKVAKAEREVAERTGNADLAAKADKREVMHEQQQGNLLDAMKESLVNAADAVKTAAANAKDTAKEAADSITHQK